MRYYYLLTEFTHDLTGIAVTLGNKHRAGKQSQAENTTNLSPLITAVSRLRRSFLPPTAAFRQSIPPIVTPPAAAEAADSELWSLRPFFSLTDIMISCAAIKSVAASVYCPVS